MSVQEPLVWWDKTHRHYGWTCPDCGSSGINLGSVEQAKYGLAAHRQLCTPQRTATRAEKVVAFRAYLDELDDQTRSPGDPPLREAVAQQARERLSEMNRGHYWQRNGEGTA